MALSFVAHIDDMSRVSQELLTTFVNYQLSWGWCPKR